LLRATYVTYAFAPHTHDTFAIGVTESGTQAFTYRRTRHLIMPAGSVAIVHPGEVHTSKAADEQGWTYCMFYPDASVLQRAAAELAGRQRDTPFFPSPVIYDAELACRIRNFHIVLEDSTTTVLERESRLLWTLAHLILRHADDRPALGAAKPEPLCVQRVRVYIDEHFAEPVSLDQLATLVGLSPFVTTYASALVVVSDDAALQAVEEMLNYEKLLIEPAAECVLAALTSGQIHVASQERVASITTMRRRCAVASSAVSRGQSRSP
jgi:hypothetical protein